jgi:hypothetical protein
VRAFYTQCWFYSLVEERRRILTNWFVHLCKLHQDNQAGSANILLSLYTQTQGEVVDDLPALKADARSRKSYSSVLVSFV